MHNLSEELLQYIWRYRLLKPGPMTTCSGSTIKIIKTGEWNRDSGPDFFNGQVEVNGMVLAGNIELHVRAGDWLRHGHQDDRAYDRIILHVVFENDVAVPQNILHGVEVLELKNYIEPGVFERYAALSASPAALPCSARLGSVDEMRFISWRERMSVERLTVKSERIEALLRQCHGDYTQVMYQLLLSNFGFKVNALPFEMVARQLPARILLRHTGNLMQVEALLLGTAGMLEEQLGDKYLHTLQNEFAFLQRKYGLIPLGKEIFKHSRLRPANFPGLRLAQFAALVNSHPNLLNGTPVIEDVTVLRDLLMAEPAPYWRHHYRVGGKATAAELRLGESSAENLIINTFAPFYFFYGQKFSKERYKDLALEMLSRCAAEDNRKTRFFSAKKPLIDSAAGSQAMIHLFDNYCENKKCLHCGIGLTILGSGPRPAETAEPLTAYGSRKAA